MKGGAGRFSSPLSLQRVRRVSFRKWPRMALLVKPLGGGFTRRKTSAGLRTPMFLGVGKCCQIRTAPLGLKMDT